MFPQLRLWPPDRAPRPNIVCEKRAYNDFVLSRRSLLALAASLPAWGWQDADFSTGIRVVSLLATVRDKSGKFVTGLTQDDFTVEEDGRPQMISYFDRQDDMALTMGLLVDISSSQTGDKPQGL